MKGGYFKGVLNPLMQSMNEHIRYKFYPLEEKSSSCLALTIKSAVDEGADLLSISMGTYEDNEYLKEAIQYAFGKCIIVAASGDDASSSEVFPAAYSECISISCIDQLGNAMRFNNRGEWIDFCAPGEKLIVNINGRDYGLDGSSGATVIAACVIAAIMLHEPGIRFDQLMQCLTYGCDDLGELGKDSIYGFGRLNLYNSIKHLKKKG